MGGLSDMRVLLVGAGGLGSPAATILAKSGVGHLEIVDDDRVELSNLQRQTLYGAADAGALKAPTAARSLARAAASRGLTLDPVAREMRIVPDTAAELVEGHDLVLEGADNFATKFLVADACKLASVPLVQAGAVRWGGWALANVPGRGACLRCVFEDIPRGQPDTCADAGVVGPVVGVLGALQAAMALRLLSGAVDVAGELWSYRGLDGSLRRHRPQARPGCPLCEGEIRDLDMERYLPPECAA